MWRTDHHRPSRHLELEMSTVTLPFDAVKAHYHTIDLIRDNKTYPISRKIARTESLEPLQIEVPIWWAEQNKLV